MSRQSIGNQLTKWWRRYAADGFKNFRRQLKRGIRNPGLALGYQGFRRAIARQDWSGAHRRLAPLAEAAEKAGDLKLLTEMGFSAERLGEHELSTRLHAVCRRMSGGGFPDEWDGGDLSDATLAVRFMESEKQGLAVGLAMAGYVAEAAGKAAHCSLVVEKRLVPIFERALPKVEVLAFPANVETKPGSRLVSANQLTLKSNLGTESSVVENRFLPLKPRDEEASELRKCYLADRKLPLIGISWWSSHFGKDLPSVAEWADFLRETDAIFVSVQYGDVDADLEAFKQAAPDRVIVDDSVDQMTDMDGFASQLGALDAIVTISNTGAHLAGAMGIPTCLIRDDWFRRAWPVLSDRTPWYPETRVYGKDGKPWPEVFKRVGERLAELETTD